MPPNSRFPNFLWNPVERIYILVASWFILLVTVIRRNLSPRKTYHLPGPTPFPVRVIGNLFQLPPPRKLMDRCREWFAKYGPCYLISVFNTDFVVVADAAVAKTLLASQELGHLSKASLYQFMSDIDGLGFTNGQEWRAMRKLTATVFSFNLKEYQIGLFNDHADTFVASLTNTEVDNKNRVQQLLGEFAIKIIIDTYITGANAYTKTDLENYLNNFAIFNETTLYRIMHPWLAFQTLWKLHPKYSRYIKAVKSMRELANNIIDRHLQGQKNNNDGIATEKDCVTEKMSLIDTMQKSSYSLVDVEKEITGLLFAHETNTLGSYYFLCMLALHPEHQAKCRSEVDEVLGSSQADFISFESLAKLKYTERCLLEAMRLLPPVFIFGRRLDSELTLDNGVTLAPGTNVLVTPLTMHKSPDYFPNPEVFDPDRFLPEECHKRNSYAYLAFAGGPRQCLGMKAAIMEIKILAAKILRHFYISTDDKLEDMTFRLTLTMSPEKELDMTFTPRATHGNPD